MNPIFKIHLILQDLLFMPRLFFCWVVSSLYTGAHRVVLCLRSIPDTVELLVQLIFRALSLQPVQTIEI